MKMFWKIVNREVPTKKIFEDDVVIVIINDNYKSNGRYLVIPNKYFDDIYKSITNNLHLFISVFICFFILDNI